LISQSSPPLEDVSTESRQLLLKTYKQPHKLQGGLLSATATGLAATGQQHRKNGQEKEEEQKQQKHSNLQRQQD
jgi:hypothetical protein